MNICQIYLLRDPRNSEVRYVGKTVRELQARLRAHVCRTNLTPKRHSSRWIAGLVKSGLKPAIELIETVAPEADWQERERYWISEYRRRGARLTNLANGGEGVAGVRFSEARKREQSEKFKGRVFDAEWRAKISAAKRGVPGKRQSPEAVAKRVAAIKRTRAQNYRAKTHCVNGHEWIAENLTAPSKGNPSCKLCKRDYFKRTYVPNPQTREQRAAALEIVRRQPGFREKLSEAAKRRRRKAA